VGTKKPRRRCTDTLGAQWYGGGAWGEEGGVGEGGGYNGLWERKAAGHVGGEECELSGGADPKEAHKAHNGEGGNSESQAVAARHMTGWRGVTKDLHYSLSVVSPPIGHRIPTPEGPLGGSARPEALRHRKHLHGGRSQGRVRGRPVGGRREVPRPGPVVRRERGLGPRCRGEGVGCWRGGPAA